MKKVLFIIFVVLFVIFLIFSFYLVFTSESKSVFNEIEWTEGAKEAYSNGDEILTHEADQQISTDGNMRCYAIIWIPSANELQVTVKHNVGVYEKMGVSPDVGFGFKLYNTGNGEEYNTKEGDEFTEYTAKREEKGRYAFYKLVFSGVKLDPETEDLEIVMYAKHNEDKFSVMKLHNSGAILGYKQVFEPYDFSKGELAALKGEEK